MTSIRSLVLGAAVGFVLLQLGCANDHNDDASASSEISESYAEPGANLGKSTHLFTDVVDDATFAVFGGALERRTADGTIQPIAKVAAGFDDLIVSKTRIAFLTSSIVNNSYKVLLHVHGRVDGWKEVLTHDFSEGHAPYRHPIAFLDDDTIAVGNGDEIDVFAADGTMTKLAGYNSKFRADEVTLLYPAGDAGHLYAALDNDETYLVDVKANTIALQPTLEGADNRNRRGTALFEPKSKTWIATDFQGVKLYGTDGKLKRKADLVTAKNRYISNVALLDDNTLLVTNQTEKSQERSMLAKYDLETLTRTELGSFDGMIGELAPGKSGRLFYLFSPRGAQGFNSHVWYAYARNL